MSFTWFFSVIFPEYDKQGCFDEFSVIFTVSTLRHFSSFVILFKNLVKADAKMQVLICGFLLYADQ